MGLFGKLSDQYQEMAFYHSFCSSFFCRGLSPAFTWGLRQYLLYHEYKIFLALMDRQANESGT